MNRESEFSSYSSCARGDLLPRHCPSPSSKLHYYKNKIQSKIFCREKGSLIADTNCGSRRSDQDSEGRQSATESLLVSCVCNQQTQHVTLLYVPLRCCTREVGKIKLKDRRRSFKTVGGIKKEKPTTRSFISQTQEAAAADICDVFFSISPTTKRGQGGGGGETHQNKGLHFSS